MDKMIVAIVAGGLTLLPTAASAWSAENCRSMCRQTAMNAESCFRQMRCNRFKGRHEPAYIVKQRSDAWLKWNGRTPRP